MSAPSITTAPSGRAVEPVGRNRRRWRLLIAALAASAIAIALFIALGSEDPPVLENGGFETGDLTGWTVESFGAGDWFVYQDGTTPPDPSTTDPDPAFNVPDPPEGQYAAVTDMDFKGVHFLYRDIEVTGPWVLHATVFYENHGKDILDPLNFGTFIGEVWSGGGYSNQQFRIDLIHPEAVIHSLEADDVLATVFWTRAGDAPALGPTPVTMDLSPWEGQTVRLRATQIDNAGPLRAGIDDVRLEHRSD